MNWSQIPTFVRDRKTGRISINPQKQFVQPFELGMDAGPTVINGVITIAPGAQAGPLPLSARFDGPIESFYLKLFVRDAATGLPVTDYALDWFLEHPGKRKQFMNRRIPMLATWGDAGRPYVLPESIWIPPVQALQMTIFSRDARTLLIEPVYGGIKFYPNAAPETIRREMWPYILRRERTYVYWMTTDAITSLTAGQTNLARTMTIPDSADLEVFKLSSESTGDFRLRILDGQSDRAINSARQAASLLFGGHDPTALAGGIGGSGGCFPARWATTFLIRRSIQLDLQFDDARVAPVGNNDVRIVFGGRKVAYA